MKKLTSAQLFAPPKKARKTKTRLERAKLVIAAARKRAAIRAARTAQQYAVELSMMRPPTVLQRRRLAERLRANSWRRPLQVGSRSFSFAKLLDEKPVALELSQWLSQKIELRESVIGALAFICQPFDQALLIVNMFFHRPNVSFGFGKVIAFVSRRLI
jgi:hypothetical protein